MSLSEQTNEEGQESSLYKTLHHIASEIKLSWIKDCDKTDAMIALNNFISNILRKDEPLEEVFNQDEKLLQYFMTDCLKEVINNILLQPIVYGENGDDIALELLFHIYKLFLKYHENKKYAPLFEKVREIVNTEKSSFKFFAPPNEFRGQQPKIENPKRKYNFYNFNHRFCKDYINETKENESIFKEGENIDLLIKYERSRTSIDKKAWVRGKIKSIDKENFNYIIECPELDSDINIQIHSPEVIPEGIKTKDWEWRRNLKKYDLIDCFDRNRWYPSTVYDVKELVLENGYKRITYKIGFKIYPKFFKNKNDENDKYENYKCFWENKELELDEKINEEFYGDKSYDEDIEFYSKRIQKFGSYTSVQKEFLNQPTQYSVYGTVNRPTGNKMQIMNYDLENDGEDYEINEDMFIYEKDGKKNYIIGKSAKFSFYFALFLKKLADENVFVDFIKIINNKPNSEEIFTIFHTLNYALPYLNRQYLVENLDNFKNAIINFINNLDNKEIRNLQKELIETITKFLKNVNSILKLNEKKENENSENKNENDRISVLDEITISLSIKMIKTSIFDKRIQGIKGLNDYIEENNKKENSMKILVDLIQKKEIIKEIFGANYHSQIISKSNKILALLSKYNALKEEDIKLIWDCTQRGDLEAKTTIMKLLSDVAENLNENFINILLQSIINTIDKNKINEKEIDFIYNLSIHGDNENNKIKCCEYLYQCILKLDLSDNNIQKNPIMDKLVSFCGKDDKYLSKVLSMCENDLKTNNCSLIILQILSAILDRYSFCHTEIYYMKDYLKEFVKDDNLLILFKNNFNDYNKRIRELIKDKNKNSKGTEEEKIGNYDEEIIDNYTHVINIQKRIEFLKDWINTIYPNFEFVPFLKEILLDKPASINDSALFYEFMKKYISETKVNESKEQKEKRDNIKNQLFKIFTENNQNSMTMSEFRLFMAIFFGINDKNIVYIIDPYDNYDITVLSDNIDDLKEMDKLWNVIFQLKDEAVLNKSISIIFNLYKSKDQIEKLLNKCTKLIKGEKTTSEIIDKCFKILRTIIIESEKNNIIKTKSHSNLIKNSLVYLPLKITSKFPEFYYNRSDDNDSNENISEIFYGNTTINEIKQLLIEKGKVPLQYIEISLSKEYMTKLKEAGKKNSKEKENKSEENELLLDETYNNKSIIEILDKNYNFDLMPNKIFIFKKKNIEKVNLLEENEVKELNPKFKKILKEWFDEFTDGTGKMDQKACAKFISKVTTTKEMVSENDERIKGFFEEYDKENLGYVTEETFYEFYLNCLKEKKDSIVWENIISMGIREDLHKKSEPDEIPYIENKKLPRYALGNDKQFIETLFNMFNKFENKKNIFVFLFFLSTNKEMYDLILYKFNKKEEKNFGKIFEDKNKILEQLYALTIIESILQDIDVTAIDFTVLFEKCRKNENGTKNNIIMKSKNYEYFDDIELNKKKEFLKEFIINGNYENLLKYMNNLLVGYKFNEKENDNIVLNLCYEKCFKVINILYNACFESSNIQNEKKEEKENMSNNSGILILDCNNLCNIINEDNNIKNNISQISFLDFSTNLIKFVTNINNYLNKNESNLDNDKNKNLLENSFNLLINLISYNEKLLKELDSKAEAKEMLSSSIKSSLTCHNEYYKSFYLKCLLNSVKSISSSPNKKDNKFLNLLFELTTDIFNEMLSENSDNNNISSKSSILFFDFFSLLSSIKTDGAGNEFLFKIYNMLFNNLKGIETETEKKISKDNFIGLMNILIKRIKNNEESKYVIANKEIEGKTLIEIILEKIYKNEEKEKEKEDLINEPINTDEETSKFINLDSIKENKEQKKEGISKEIKYICNDYLIECFKSSKDPKIFKELTSIIKLLNEKIGNENEENGQNKKKTSISTKNFNHVGLKNMGCICYMNSIMQQIYMVPTFRYAIMGSDDHESPKPSEYGRMTCEDDNLLHQLQIMYTFLTYSEKEDYNPKYFCYSFKDFDGNPTNPMIQQDSQEFYNNFCDKIENCLKKTKYKYIINDVFIGRTCSSVICESCKHVSNRFEDFYNLSLEVKNLYNLNDSLQKMISPEKIDDFKCSNCNKNVTISKRTSLCDLPNILVVHLKRFYMNYEIERTEKINSRFEFPFDLNLKKFCIEDIVTQISGKKFEDADIYEKEDEYYKYELKGINIHMGSADGGHYFSLINIERDGEGNILIEKKNNNKNNETNNEEEKNNKWLKFNDSHISIFDLNDIEKDCFGGARKGGYNFENFQNAYMLLYERKKKAPIRIIIEENQTKEMNIDDSNNVKINKDNRKEIKKQFDLFKNSNKIDEKSLYEKLFNDEEKSEYYKYIPYYNIEKMAPRKVYNQVMEKNKQLEKMKNSSEADDIKYKKEYYEVLINNISLEDFNILSDNYNTEIKKDLINLLVHSIFTLVTNKYPSEEEKVMVNSKTKLILEKIILPFINPYIKHENELNQNKNNDYYLYTLIIKNILIDKDKLEKIYVNDLTAIFDSNNVKLFSDIIKGILAANYTKNNSGYLALIEMLFNLIQSIENTSTYPTITNSESNIAPLYYIYEILYKSALNDKKTTEKLLNQSAISTFLGKLSSENAQCRNIIYDIVTYLIKNTDGYNENLFEIKENEKICNNYFHEKTYLTKKIPSSIVELLFDERVDLLIILIKMLQYNESNFSLEFNIENIYLLFEYAFRKNKLMDMIKVLLGILEINDKFTFQRINYILGYPTLIIKQINVNDKNEKNNELYEERKEDEEGKKEKAQKERNNYWPLFGERLILEENGKISEKNEKNLKKRLKTHIFKYIGCFHKKPSYCLLPLLFPIQDINEKNDDEDNIFEEKERKQIIFDFLKLMLLGRGNYCIFKYIYLLPARTLYYKNLYEEMIDILEESNKKNNNLYNLEEIKKNAEMCIKRINYEVKKAIEDLKESKIYYDDYKNNEEYKLPEMMKKYYVDSDETEKFIGINPNIIQSDIVREEIKIIASGSNMYLIRLEYFTKYKTKDEIINDLDKNKIEDKKVDKKEVKNEKQDEKKEKEEKRGSEEEEKKHIEEEKNESESDNHSEEEEHRTFKIDISEIKKEIDGKEFMFELIRTFNRKSIGKYIIEDSSIKNKNRIKSTLIRFIILNAQPSESDMHIKISEKHISDQVRENYYYPSFFIDNIKRSNISNLLNINRIRKDLPFLKTNDIGINIDVKKPREEE